MNVERFKEEFSELRRRFAATESDENVQSTVAPLTNQEIVDAVHEVLNFKLDVTLVDSLRDDVRTPASGIVVTTPNAPDIPKLDAEHNGGISERFRSLDTLEAECLRDSPIDNLVIPKPELTTVKTNDDADVVAIDIPNANNDEKKKMSESTPMVAIVRSDTFVREDEFETVKSNVVGDEKKFGPSVIVNDSSNEQPISERNRAEVIKKLKALKVSVIDTITNIILDIQKIDPEESLPAIRRLSAIGCFPGLNRATTAAKSTQRTKINRRSLSAFPDTPTSSRLSPGTEAKNDAMRRKSTSALSLINVGAAAKLSIAPAHRSVSSGALLPPKNPSNQSTLAQGSQFSSIKAPKAPTTLKSPALSLLSAANKSPAYRQTRSNKYAHVQSTIPKTGITIGKRKSTDNLKN